MRNKRAGYCFNCDALVPVGEGEVAFWSDEDLDEIGRYDEDAGWKVEHFDKAICAVESAKAVEVAQQRKSEDDEIISAYQTAAVGVTQTFRQRVEAIPTTGLVSTGYAHPSETETREVARMYRNFTSPVHEVVKEALWRGTWYAVIPQGAASTWLMPLAEAKEAVRECPLDITSDKATEWLKQYSGCAYTEAYQLAAGVEPAFEAASEVVQRYLDHACVPVSVPRRDVHIAKNPEFAPRVKIDEAS